MADVFGVTVEDDDVGCRPGDRLIVNAANPTWPYAIMRRLSRADADRIIAAGVTPLGQGRLDTLARPLASQRGSQQVG